MASRGLVIGGVVVAALGGLALMAGSASAAEGNTPPPPPPPPGGGSGRTAKQIAMAHPAYQEWLAAVTECDKYYAYQGDDPGIIAAGQDWCGQAAYLARIMSEDGVPPGQWR
jgi:hypothetical protein